VALWRSRRGFLFDTFILVRIINIGTVTGRKPMKLLRFGLTKPVSHLESELCFWNQTGPNGQVYSLAQVCETIQLDQQFTLADLDTLRVATRFLDHVLSETPALGNVQLAKRLLMVYEFENEMTFAWERCGLSGLLAIQRKNIAYLLKQPQDKRLRDRAFPFLFVWARQLPHLNTTKRQTGKTMHQKATIIDLGLTRKT